MANKQPKLKDPVQVVHPKLLAKKPGRAPKTVARSAVPTLRRSGWVLASEYKPDGGAGAADQDKATEPQPPDGGAGAADQDKATEPGKAAAGRKGGGS